MDMASNELHFLGQWDDITQEHDWPWKNFTPKELRQRSDGKLYVVPSFLCKLQAFRIALNFIMPANSYYRSPEYNMKVSSTGPDGPHTTGRAIDIRVAGANAFEMVSAAKASGFTGIGVGQKGPWEKRFIHLDDLPNSDKHPRPRIWPY